MNSEVKRTLKELFTGIAFSTFLVAALSVLAAWMFRESFGITFDLLLAIKLILGALSGGALACFMAWHMARALDKAVDMDEKSALNHTRKKYIIRTAIVLCVVVLLYYTGFVNLISMLFSLFGLKTAAYMQPLIHKLQCGQEKEAGTESEGE